MARKKDGLKGWWERPATGLDHVVLALVIAAGIGGLYALNWYLRFHVVARCDEVSGGWRCAVSHTSRSSKDLDVCVELKRLCANGKPSVGQGCFAGAVAPKAYGDVLIGNAEFTNAADCPSSNTPPAVRVYARTESGTAAGKPDGQTAQ